MTSAEAATTRPDLPHLSLPRRRARSTGFWVSLAVHAALLALVWTRHDLLIPTPRPGDPRFGNLGGGGGGGGGGGQEATYIIALPPVPPPTPAATTPLPLPVVTPPKAETPVPQPVLPPVAQDTVPAAQIASATPGAGAGGAKGTGPGTGGGSGGGSGGGQGGGVGPGAGPGTGTGGEGGNIRPPELRGLAIPFSTPPRELRGKTVKVTFAITTDGRVERFETDPVITDRGYYRKFSEIVLGFRFRPARGPDGQPVAVVFPMEFTLPTQ